MKLTHADKHSFSQIDQLLAEYFPLDEKGIETNNIAVGSSKIRVRNVEGDFVVESTRHPSLNMEDFTTISVVSDPDNNKHYVYRWDFVARIDIANRRAELLMAPIAHPMSIDTIVRIATSFAAIDNGGFLMHSSCINRDGDAFMFCGVSGSGKSTMARLSQERYQVFTDEMTLIEKQGDGYVAWGTPFWGDMQMSVHESAPLKGIFYLAQSQDNAIEELPRSERVKEMMRVIMCFGQEKVLAEKLLQQTIDFVSVVPFNRLHFRPEISVWDVINEKFKQ